MLKIRLARYGKKKQPAYRVVVSDSRKDTQGTYIESVGHYEAVAHPAVFSVDAGRVKHWISQGAQASPTVHNLLVENGVVEGPKVKASKSVQVKTEVNDAEEGVVKEADVSDETGDDAPEKSDEQSDGEPETPSEPPSEEAEKPEEASEEKKED